MEYIHIRNLEKFHPGITSEAHLEKYLIKNWKEFFNLDFIRTRKKISKKSIIDILAQKDNEIVIIELKFRSLRTKDKKQLNRYLREFPAGKGILIGYNRMTEEIEVIA